MFESNWLISCKIGTVYPTFGNLVLKELLFSLFFYKIIFHYFIAFSCIIFTARKLLIFFNSNQMQSNMHFYFVHLFRYFSVETSCCYSKVGIILWTNSLFRYSLLPFVASLQSSWYYLQYSCAPLEYGTDGCRYVHACAWFPWNFQSIVRLLVSKIPSGYGLL